MASGENEFDTPGLRGLDVGERKGLKKALSQVTGVHTEPGSE